MHSRAKMYLSSLTWPFQLFQRKKGSCDVHNGTLDSPSLLFVLYCIALHCFVANLLIISIKGKTEDRQCGSLTNISTIHDLISLIHHVYCLYLCIYSCNLSLFYLFIWLYDT